MVSVPNLVGRLTGEGERLLGSAGLVASTRVVDSDQTRGTIVSQTPNPGTELAAGSTVLLSVASGPPPAPVRGAADETQQLLRVLRRYKTAYESLDAKAVAAVYPSVERHEAPGRVRPVLENELRHTGARRRHQHRRPDRDGHRYRDDAAREQVGARPAADDDRRLHDAAVRHVVDDTERLH